MGSAERIVNHAHCRICGRAVPFGEKTCGPECAARFEENRKKRQTMMWLIYGAMALAIAVLIYGVVR